MASSEDDGFMKVLDKKLRGLRKKLDKIKSLEASEKEGKTLNEQQKGVLENKSEYEKFYQEYEGLKEAYLESKKVSVAEASGGEGDSAVVKADEGAKQKGEHNVEIKSEATSMSPKDSNLTVDVGGNGDDSTDIERILRLLHTVQQCQALATPVPGPLYLFSKVLCGAMKSPLEVDFGENLAESVEQARLFLHGSQTEVQNGISYAQLEDLVLEMVAEPEVAVAAPPSPAAAAEPEDTAEVPTATPQSPTTE
jgi:hypothetical protein